jgi:hypothetical protein
MTGSDTPHSPSFGKATGTCILARPPENWLLQEKKLLLQEKRLRLVG